MGTSPVPVDHALPQPPSGPARGRTDRPRWTGLLAAEAIKLRRSLVWAFAVLLPLLAVVTGTVNYAGNQGVLSSGWESYMGQVTLFYALFFFSIGVSLVCASVWRPEHRGTSWTAMRTTPSGAARVAVAKTVIAVGPVAVMQALLVLMSWLSGTVVLHLGGGLPVGVLATGLLGILAALPLVALQSLLAMVLRSFGAPVALGMLGTMVGLGASYAGGLAPSLWPYSLVTGALTLGTSALSTAGSLSLSGVAPLLRGTLLSGVLCWALLLGVARARERR